MINEGHDQSEKNQAFQADSRGSVCANSWGMVINCHQFKNADAATHDEFRTSSIRLI